MQRVEHLARGARVSRSLEADRAHRHVVVMPHEVVLETQSTTFGVKDGGDLVVGDRQESDLQSPVLGDLSRDVTLGSAFAESLTAVEVGGEIAVTEAKPGGAPE